MLKIVGMEIELLQEIKYLARNTSKLNMNNEFWITKFG